MASFIKLTTRIVTKHCAVFVSINWIPRLKSVVHGDIKKEAESIINGNILITV